MIPLLRILPPHSFFILFIFLIFTSRAWSVLCHVCIALTLCIEGLQLQSHLSLMIIVALVFMVPCFLSILVVIYSWFWFHVFGLLPFPFVYSAFVFCLLQVIFVYALFFFSRLFVTSSFRLVIVGLRFSVNKHFCFAFDLCLHFWNPNFIQLVPEPCHIGLLKKYVLPCMIVTIYSP